MSVLWATLGFLAGATAGLILFIEIYPPTPAQIVLEPRYGLQVPMVEVNRICNARKRMEAVCKKT